MSKRNNFFPLLKECILSSLGYLIAAILLISLPIIYFFWPLLFPPEQPPASNPITKLSANHSREKQENGKKHAEDITNDNPDQKISVGLEQTDAKKVDHSDSERTTVNDYVKSITDDNPDQKKHSVLEQPKVRLEHLGHYIPINAENSPKEPYAMEYIYIELDIRNVGTAAIPKDVLLATLPQIEGEDFATYGSPSYNWRDNSFWNRKTPLPVKGLAKIAIAGYFKKSGNKHVVAKFLDQKLEAKIQVLPHQGCYDADGGKNYDVKSWTLGATPCAKQEGWCNNFVRHEDSCAGEKLHEFLCSRGKFGVFESVSCAYGCQDGRCLKQGENGTEKILPEIQLEYLGTHIDFIADNSPKEPYAMEDLKIVLRVKNVSKDLLNDNLPLFETEDFVITDYYGSNSEIKHHQVIKIDGALHAPRFHPVINDGELYASISGYFKTHGDKYLAAEYMGHKLETKVHVLPDPGCYDADGGKNDNVKSWAIGPTRCLHQDKCLATDRKQDQCSGNLLFEASCSSDGFIGYSRKECSNGCHDGRCLKTGEVAP